MLGFGLIDDSLALRAGVGVPPEAREAGDQAAQDAWPQEAGDEEEGPARGGDLT